MLIIKKQTVISLLVALANVCLLGIHLAKRRGNYTILRLKSFLFLAMSNSMSIIFLFSILLTLPFPLILCLPTLKNFIVILMTTIPPSTSTKFAYCSTKNSLSISFVTYSPSYTKSTTYCLTHTLYIIPHPSQRTIKAQNPFSP